MISLDSPLWSRLRHAYGPASDTPALLRRLSSDPRPSADHYAEPWHSLWSSLCHQGDVYTASYAAVPHIVETAMGTSADIDVSFFLLPACIEISRRNGHGPDVPGELADAYHDAITNLAKAICAHIHAEWDRHTTQAAAAALAVAKGHALLAEALTNLDDDMIARIVNEGE
ncbi:MAG TPA: hypothetical protein VFA23_00410 [Dongiaceae bacterium]|nr:hypothetical protein [Dongiaceae bacterium]